MLESSNMSSRTALVVSMMAMVGMMTAACSGTTTGSDLTGDGGGGNGGNGGAGGLLGSVGGTNGGTSKGSTGSTGSTTQQTSPTNPTKTPAPATKGAGVCGTGDATGSATCDACLDPTCCTSITACNDNAECLAELQCAKACNGDRECGTQCRQDHPQGDADLQAFIACVQGNCEAACQ